ncbi:hypothetical protein chiPu_0006309 [Chiloscyllium punctatum]|uniref:Uncharacterized protein n=1 Tax=Chiloscyllium punctatum TaxID=137246 RepID=A0A401SC14_CHIPU|nr:hypothetical protein [Chiloscyllium punctatum]
MAGAATNGSGAAGCAATGDRFEWQAAKGRVQNACSREAAPVNVSHWNGPKKLEADKKRGERNSTGGILI